jgi:hypothetical protein
LVISGITVTQIKAGEHPSSTAGRGEIVIDVQYLSQEKDEFGLGGHVKREVEAHLAAVCQADPYLRKHPIRVDWILEADCAVVSADHPFVASFQSATSKAGPILAGSRDSLNDITIPHRPRANPGTVFALPSLLMLSEFLFRHIRARSSRDREAPPLNVGGLGGFGGFFHS